MGAIVIPEAAAERLFRTGQLNIHSPPDVRFGERMNEPGGHNDVVIIPAPNRSDAVMMVAGTLWDFEKCRDCFFIPGFAFSQGRQ